MATLTASTVRTERDIEDFIDLPYRLYRNQPCWLPQLKSSEVRRFSKKENPTLQIVDTEHFIVRDQTGHSHARICATVDPHYQHKMGQHIGLFGFFEADSEEAAKVAIDIAIDWLSRKGIQTVKGPFSHRSTEETGLLIKGFEVPSRLLQSWNPPEYRRYMENSGFVIDYTLSIWHSDRDRWLRFGQNSLAKKMAVMSSQTNEQITIEYISPPFVKKNYDDLVEIFNRSFVNNSDVVPLDIDTLMFQSRPLMPFLRPEHSVMFHQNGKVIAFLVTVPDLSDILRMLNGRLGPIKLCKLPKKIKSIDTLNVALIGADPKHVGRGLGRIMAQTISNIYNEFGYLQLETTWIDDRNTQSKAVARMSGLRPIKKLAIMSAEIPNTLSTGH